MSTATSETTTGPPPEAPGRPRKPSSNLIPGFVIEIGGMVLLTANALRLMLTPPFDYGPELVAQLRFVVKICWFPLILTSFALSFGPAGIQASDFLGLFGHSTGSAPPTS
jgi:hypothetical protein